MVEKLNKLKSKITSEIFIIELVFFIGLIIIITTNFFINKYFGMYFLGAVLIIFSLFLFRFRKRGE